MSKVVLDVGLIAQENPEWCWAASLQMLLTAYGVGDLQQCQIAKLCDDNGGGVDCCKGGLGTKACGRSSLEKALAKYKIPKPYYQPWTAYANPPSFTFASIQAEIDAGHPFIFVANYDTANPNKDLTQDTKGTHMMIGIGYDDPSDGADTTQQFVIFNDPAPVGQGCECYISFSCFAGPDLLGVYMPLLYGEKFVTERPAAIVAAVDPGVPGPAGPWQPPINPPPFLRSNLDRSAVAAQKQTGLALQLANVPDGTPASLGLPFLIYTLSPAQVEDEALPTLLGGFEDKTLRPDFALYPLYGGQTLLTSFELKDSTADAAGAVETWDNCCFGSAILYVGLDELRGGDAQSQRIALDQYFALSIPYLGLWFLVSYAPSPIVPVAIIGNPGNPPFPPAPPPMLTRFVSVCTVDWAGLERGNSYTAAQVASILQKISIY